MKYAAAPAWNAQLVARQPISGAAALAPEPAPEPGPAPDPVPAFARTLLFAGPGFTSGGLPPQATSVTTSTIDERRTA